MMPKGSLCTGFMYTHDRWSRYWEGTRERDNGNIGTLTTRQLAWVANYGLTDQLNVIAMLPYVWTHASAGNLQGMRGAQDLSVALKYNLFAAEAGAGTWRAFVVGSLSVPAGDYTPDFLPLSIGTQSRRVSGVAQYEALKAAWYYKRIYGRRSPARLDNSVQALLPATDLPAYPSEDAVLSGVTAEMLKLLFPASIEEITLKAGQQRDAALWSGRAAPSDVAAGLALGKAVAAVVVARAGADGMRQAVGTAALWQALADRARARGEIPWQSLESPPRPPLLANFGHVRSWMMTAEDVVRERPPGPPSTSSGQMQQETAEVRSVVANLTREQLAIAYKWADGVGTYTPPGHWNDIATEYIRDAGFSEVRAARAFALLNMAMHDGAVGCWETKYFFFNPRPSQLDPSIRTPLGVPNFPAYASGHSTFSAAAAAVLGYLFPSAASEFDAMRDEAGVSRLYGGIHYRSDIEAGKDHGQRMAAYTLRFARQDGAD